MSPWTPTTIGGEARRQPRAACSRGTSRRARAPGTPRRSAYAVTGGSRQPPGSESQARRRSTSLRARPERSRRRRARFRPVAGSRSRPPCGSPESRGPPSAPARRATARTPGRKTCCSGAAMRRNGVRITVVASVYAPSAAAPSTRAMRIPLTLRAVCQTMFCAKTLPANPLKRLKLAVEKPREGLQGFSTQSSVVEMAASASSWPTIAHAPDPASAIAMPVTAPTTRGGDLTELELSELHPAHEQRHVGCAQRVDDEADRECDEEPANLALAVEVRQRRRKRDAGDGQSEAECGADPEDGRLVLIPQVATLDQGRAQRVVREDDGEAREQDHHRREPPVVRGQKPREDERDGHARDLESQLRACLPRDPAQDAGADRVGSNRLRRHASAAGRGIRARGRPTDRLRASSSPERSAPSADRERVRRRARRGPRRA